MIARAAHWVIARNRRPAGRWLGACTWRWPGAVGERAAAARCGGRVQAAAILCASSDRNGGGPAWRSSASSSSPVRIERARRRPSVSSVRARVAMASRRVATADRLGSNEASAQRRQRVGGGGGPERWGTLSGKCLAVWDAPETSAVRLFLLFYYIGARGPPEHQSHTAADITVL